MNVPHLTASHRRARAMKRWLAVILLLAHTDADFAKARRQLGLRYGHLALGRPAYLDQFLDYYGEWLHMPGRKHSPQIFRHWAEQDYCPGGCRAALQVMDKPAQIAGGEPIALKVRARNDGIKPWRLRAGNDAGIHLALDIKDEAGNPVAQARSGLFDAEVAVWQSIALSLPVPALSPGRYHFFLDMIEEQRQRADQICAVFVRIRHSLVDRIYVRDSVLTLYEGRPEFTIHPESGSVSRGNQWSVSPTRRVGRDLIAVDLKKLYEGTPPETVRHWHAEAVPPPPGPFPETRSGTSAM